MTGKSHIFLGMCTGIALGIITESNDPMVAIQVSVLSSVGSLFPDIDNQNSKLGRKIKPISYLINKTLKHRGLIHTPFFLIISAILCFLCLILFNKIQYSTLLLGFIAGYLSHLLLDTFTVGGIMWLYPFKKEYYNLTNIKTGSFFEYLISLGCGIVVCLIPILVLM